MSLESRDIGSSRAWTLPRCHKCSHVTVRFLDVLMSSCSLEDDDVVVPASREGGDKPGEKDKKGKGAADEEVDEVSGVM